LRHDDGASVARNEGEKIMAIMTRAELEKDIMDTLRGVVAKEFPDLEGPAYEWKVSQIIAAMCGAVLVNSETGEVEYDPYDPKYWDKKP
jgi:hypothetical protein